MKLKDMRYSYLLQLVMLLLMLLGLGIFHEITEVNALGFYGQVPTGADAMGTAVELRPDSELHATIMNDMYGRSPLFADLENRDEPFSYIVTVTLVDDEVDRYTYLFAPQLGNTQYDNISYSYRYSINNINGLFISDYGFNGLVYSADGTYLHHVSPPLDFYSYWYTRRTGTDSQFGSYNISNYGDGLTFGTYMIYTNAPNYTSDFILSEFSTGNFDGDGSGSTPGPSIWAALIGFFTSIWEWLTSFFTNLTDWFVSILDILWDWLLLFIEFVLGLFIPTDIDGWVSLMDDIRNTMRGAFGAPYFIFEYLIGILVRISTAPVVSEVNIPGNFFGSSISFDFSAMAENAPAAWSMALMLLRGSFILSVWPSVIDFYFQFLFRDYTSASTKSSFIDSMRGD